MLLVVAVLVLLFQCVAIVGFVVVCDRCCCYCLYVVDFGGCGAVDAVVWVCCCWIENRMCSLLLLFVLVVGVGGGAGDVVV